MEMISKSSRTPVRISPASKIYYPNHDVPDEGFDIYGAGIVYLGVLDCYQYDSDVLQSRRVTTNVFHLPGKGAVGITFTHYVDQDLLSPSEPLVVTEFGAMRDFEHYVDKFLLSSKYTMATFTEAESEASFFLKEQGFFDDEAYESYRSSISHVSILLLECLVCCTTIKEHSLSLLAVANQINAFSELRERSKKGNKS